MEYTAIIQKAEGWWIGWLVELPGVNAQEKTREELLESLRIGAEELLSLEVELPKGAELERVVAERSLGGVVAH